MDQVFDHNNNHNDTLKPPSPIFVRGIADFTEVWTRLIDLVRSPENTNNKSRFIQSSHPFI